MKKIVVAVLGVLVFSTSAFAAVNDVTSTTGSLVIGEGTRETSIGLSPKVVARYVTNGTADETAQWYAIATVHPGGNLGYGTAQDVNNIYMKCYTTGGGTADITGSIPVEPNPEPPADAEALPTDWAGNEWFLTTPVCN